MRRGSPKNRIVDRYVGIPLLNLISIAHSKRPQPAALRTIGVLCSPALGDTLLFSAVLRDLRAHFPAARIVHFCTRQNLAAAEILFGADERIVLDLSKPKPTIRALRAQKLDLMIDFSSWLRLTALYAHLSGAKFIAGFSTPGQYRSRAYDLAVLHRRDQHEVENYRDLLRALNIPIGCDPGVVVHQPAVEPLPGEPDLVTLHLWASGKLSAMREWPEANWLALAQQLARPKTLFVVTGAPSDLPRMEPFTAKLQQAGLRAVAYVSPDGFVSLAQILRRARLMVSVNTGVMHLAAVLGTPTIAINGPNADHRWGPWGPHAVGLQAPDGSGGYLHLGFEFDGQPEDVMERISVAQVLEAAEKLTVQ